MTGVVAGVSTKDSQAPVHWAAEEASTRRSPLRLVSAVPGNGPGEPAEDLLDAMADEVSVAWPGLEVTTEVVRGRAADALRATAAGADLLVVGADDASPFVEATSGSVTGELLTTTPCALAVVPRRGWTGFPADAPVVVGVDEPAPAHAALAYAYAAASRTGRPLTILHCAPSGGPTARSVWSRTHLTAGLGGLFPDVPVTVEEVVGDGETRLAAASRGAATLVLGARGQFASGRFGSVSRKLIRRGHCPVVVARGRAGTGRASAVS